MGGKLRETMTALTLARTPLSMLAHCVARSVSARRLQSSLVAADSDYARRVMGEVMGEEEGEGRWWQDISLHVEDEAA